MTDRTAENDACELLSRLASDSESIDRIRSALRRAGFPTTERALIREALLAAAHDLHSPPG